MDIVQKHTILKEFPQSKGRAALFATFILCSAFLLSSCIAGMQSPFTASLPKVETSPPAKFTKGAPAYTMRFQTTSFSMPGGVGGLIGGLAGGGDSRLATLRVISHPGPEGNSSPRAYHMIPSGMNMGEYLPLLPPEKIPGAPESRDQGAIDLERYTIKMYWGCGENVRKGQPRKLDTSKLKSLTIPDFTGSKGAGLNNAKLFGGDNLKAGWVEALWPNKEEKRQIPASASLAGEHFLHGNFLPHIRFSMSERHDFMGKLSLRAETDSLKEAIPITWENVPAAIGYHLTAVAFSESRKEMVVWTSSENPDANVGSQFLDTAVVRKHITAKVIMPADRNRCVIPKGIFDGMDMVMVSGTAWGEDYWASEPPRPAKPPKNWKPDWTVKGQFMSIGGIMLGMPGVAPGVSDINRSGSQASAGGNGGDVVTDTAGDIASDAGRTAVDATKSNIGQEVRRGVDGLFKGIFNR